MVDGKDRWKSRSMIEQLLLLHRNQKYLGASNEIVFDDKKFNECIHLLLQRKDQSLVFKTKSGISLSGGGFRASLYHIGVLAALAEYDLLKDMEVISCVSGGSIIGAYYYLSLKKLLRRKSDAEIVKGDYIKIIEDIERNFPKIVLENLRMRLFTNLFCNMKMAVCKTYSRTHRIGELYEDYFYKRIVCKKDPQDTSSDTESILADANEKEELRRCLSESIPMHSLIIKAKDESDEFDIRLDNFKRTNKIPQLILNATSLNTGHNFQFAATWMGEPPALIDTNVDVRPRLRRVYYSETPNDTYKNFRLGYAVGSSACVPALFNPVNMPGLYQNVNLQLVDGGVHDNQGIGALLENECKNVFISDASGQLCTEEITGSGFLNEFYRSDGVFQERIREMQFQDLFSKQSQNYFDKLIYVHLKRGLAVNAINWINNNEPIRKVYDNENLNNKVTEYGVDKELEKAISEIRTDLDSFTATESKSLMYSGYLQTMHTLGINFPKIKEEIENQNPAEKKKWAFEDIEDRFTNDTINLTKEIRIGNYRLFKWWRLFNLKVLKDKISVKILPYLLLFILAIKIILCTLRVLKTTYETSPTSNLITKYFTLHCPYNILILIAVLCLLFSNTLFKKLGFKYGIFQMIFNVLLLFFGWIICNLYIYLINPVYNYLGRDK